MVWILAAFVFVGIIGLDIAILNGVFLRCPYCRKTGTWRFDTAGNPDLEHDQDGKLMRSTQRKRCRQCGHHVDDVWSDHEGRELRRADG